MKSSGDKRSILSIGALILSLAALQSPLWRPKSDATPIAVTAGRATLISTDGDIDRVTVDDAQNATAELVGGREVLVRGKSGGTTRLVISSKDGRTVSYLVRVQADEVRAAAR